MRKTKKHQKKFDAWIFFSKKKQWKSKKICWVFFFGFFGKKTEKSPNPGGNSSLQTYIFIVPDFQAKKIFSIACFYFRTLFFGLENTKKYQQKKTVLVKIPKKKPKNSRPCTWYRIFRDVSTISRYLRDMSYRRGVWQYGRVPLTLTFQLEVAKRLCSPIACDTRSRISIMSQYVAEPKMVFQISGKFFCSNFNPRKFKFRSVVAKILVFLWPLNTTFWTPFGILFQNL